MRPRRSLVVGVVLVACCLASSATAGTGATYESQTEYVKAVFFDTPGGQGGLAADGCAFATPPRQPSPLEAVIRGEVGQVTVSHGVPYQRVNLTATVSGSVVDSAGNTLQVSGTFHDAAVNDLFDNLGELRFDGTGELALTHGVSGVIDGRAEFRFVTAPDEFDFYVTDLHLCQLA